MAAMRGPLFIGAVADAVAAALAGGDGVVIVVGSVRLARALAARGHEVVAIASSARALRRSSLDGVRARAERLPVAPARAGAVVVFEGGRRAFDVSQVRRWSDAVVEGGAVVLVTRGPRADMSRRALCAGLMELAQRAAGRLVVTSGLVVKIPG